jgi:hypothetical protein
MQGLRFSMNDYGPVASSSSWMQDRELRASERRSRGDPAAEE